MNRWWFQEKVNALDAIISSFKFMFLFSCIFLTQNKKNIKIDINFYLCPVVSCPYIIREYTEHVDLKILKIFSNYMCAAFKLQIHRVWISNYEGYS